MEIRPLTPEDVAAADIIDRDAIGSAGQRPEPERVRLGWARIEHLIATDPGGAWLAVDREQPIGVALAIRREAVWGLSMLVVAPGTQGQGVGRRLLEAAFDYGKEADAGIILSSQDPRAVRRYSRLGFELRPAVSATGVVRREGVVQPARVREGSLGDIAVTAAISRAVRGADHVRDIPVWLDLGMTLLVHESGFAVHDGGSPLLLAALDDGAAAELLAACLIASPEGAAVEITHITAGNDWAVRTALDAGLSLASSGPVFVRNMPGELAPYLPSGAYL